MKMFLILIISFLISCGSSQLRIEKTVSGKYIETKVSNIIYQEGPFLFYADGTMDDRTGKIYSYFKNGSESKFLSHTYFWKLKGNKLYIGIFYNYRRNDSYPSLNVGIPYAIDWYELHDIKEIVKN